MFKCHIHIYSLSPEAKRQQLFFVSMMLYPNATAPFVIMTCLSLKRRKTRLFRDRIDTMIKVIEQKSADYLSVVRPIMNEMEDYTVFSDSRPHDAVTLPSISYAELKAELLCHGMRIDKMIQPDVEVFNSYVKEAGFVHAAHLFVYGRLNACVAEGFSENSPFLLTKHDNNYVLMRDSRSSELLTYPQKILGNSTYSQEHRCGPKPVRFSDGKNADCGPEPSLLALASTHSAARIINCSAAFVSQPMRRTKHALYDSIALRREV